MLKEGGKRNTTQIQLLMEDSIEKYCSNDRNNQMSLTKTKLHSVEKQ